MRSGRALQTRAEVTGERDLSISAWRRTFGDGCYGCDLDFIEYRYRGGSVVPVAAIEYKAWHVTSKKLVLGGSTKAVLEIARRAGIPFWYVWYQLDFEGWPKKFQVWNVTSTGLIENYLDSDVATVFDESGFRHAIKSL